jgi:hypothetical protein
MSPRAAVTETKKNTTAAERSLSWSSIAKSLLAGGVAGGVYVFLKRSLADHSLPHLQQYYNNRETACI